jgi:hypothetical protein
MTDQAIKLPPLPYTDLRLSTGEGEPFGKGFSEDDMQAFARQAVLEERERCAKVCEELLRLLPLPSAPAHNPPRY